VAILGATASGKTQLALEVASALPVEVVSCDSMHVYEGLDVGTNKPTPSERAAVAHHLLDIVAIDGHYDAGRFAHDADAAIRDIQHRGKLPLVVGGTGLWLRALVNGLTEVSPIDAGVKARLRAELAASGLEPLRDRLRALDPELHQRLAANDTQRILRGLEVAEGTGERLSALQAAHNFRTARYAVSVFAPAIQRQELYARIDARARAMVTGGLVEETERALRAGFEPTARPLLAPGYREAQSFLRGELSRAELVEQTAQAHRRYAKRQLTWLRAERDVFWLGPGERGRVEAALRIAVGFGAAQAAGLQGEQ
jgi:tRNA dimethylallyltransferase